MIKFTLDYKQIDSDIKQSLQKLTITPDFCWNFHVIFDAKIISDSFKDKRKIDVLKKFISSDPDDFLKWQRSLQKTSMQTFKETQCLSKICYFLIHFIHSTSSLTQYEYVSLIQNFTSTFNTFFSLGNQTNNNINTNNANSSSKKMEPLLTFDIITMEMLYGMILICQMYKFKIGKIKQSAVDPVAIYQIKTLENFISSNINNKLESIESVNYVVSFYIREKLYHKAIDLLISSYEKLNSFDSALYAIHLMNAISKAQIYADGQFRQYQNSRYEDISYLLLARLLSKSPELLKKKSHYMRLICDTYKMAYKYDELIDMLTLSGGQYLDVFTLLHELIEVFSKRNDKVIIYELLMHYLQKYLLDKQIEMLKRFENEFLDILDFQIIPFIFKEFPHDFSIKKLLVKPKTNFIFEHPEMEHYQTKLTASKAIQTFLSFSAMINELPLLEGIQNIEDIEKVIYRIKLIEMKIRIGYRPIISGNNVDDDIIITSLMKELYEFFQNYLYYIETSHLKDLLEYLPTETITQLSDLFKKGYDQFYKDIGTLKINQGQIENNEQNDMADLLVKLIKKFQLYCHTSLQKLMKIEKFSKKKIYSSILSLANEMLELRNDFKDSFQKKSQFCETIYEDLTGIMLEKILNPIKMRSSFSNLASNGSSGEETKIIDSGPFISNDKTLYRDYINKYQIMYWYILELYTISTRFEGKLLNFRYCDLWDKLGFMEEYVKCFEQKTKFSDMKFHPITFDFSYIFLSTMINKRWNYYVFYILSKKMMEEYYIPFGSNIRNAKLMPLHQGNNDLLSKMIYHDEVMFQSPGFLMIQYLYVITFILLPGTLDSNEVNNKYKHIYKPPNYTFTITKDSNALKMKSIDQIKLEDLFFELDDKIDFFYDYKKFFEHPFEFSGLDLCPEIRDYCKNIKLYGLTPQKFLGLYNQTLIIIYYLSKIRMLYKTALEHKTKFTNELRQTREKLAAEISNFSDNINNYYSKFSKIKISNELNDYGKNDVNTTDPKYFYYMSWKCIIYSFEITLRMLDCMTFAPLMMCDNLTDYNNYGKYLWWWKVKEGFYTLDVNFTEAIHSLLSRKFETTQELDNNTNELIYEAMQDLRVNIHTLGNDKRVSLFKRAHFLNIDDALKKINTNFHFDYSLKFNKQIIKDSKIENLNAKIFLEKGDKLLDWNEEKQIQVNFLGGFVLDNLIINLKFWSEFMPNKYDDFQYTVDIILEDDLKQDFWEISKSLAIIDGELMFNMKNIFKTVSNSLYSSLRDVKDYLTQESNKFVNNPDIINIFNKAKDKMRDTLKLSFDENLFDNIQKKYVEGNVRSIETYINVIHRKQNCLTSMTYDTKGFKIQSKFYFEISSYLILSIHDKLLILFQ